MVRVAINGFGRIGRMIFRAGINNPEIEFVCINDLTNPENLAYLLKYDSAHGKFNGEVSFKENALIVNGKEIRVTSEKDPSKLPWKELNVDVVLECTGIFRRKEDLEKHIQAGARKVILSAPPKSDGIKTIVMGVNDSEITSEDLFISNASCTTNSLAPVVKILHENIGIVQGFMSTVHSYTADQRLVDAPHKDFRRGRSAAHNIVPTTTGAAIAVTKVIPELEGKLDGLAFRVPTVDGSVTDFVAVLKRETSKEELLELFERYKNNDMKGILDIAYDPIVSSDIIGNTHSTIIDAQATMVKGNMVKIVTWYDNEFGYSNRMIDLVLKIAKL
ncbi:MAG: hypothetical protein PWP03_114 [Candidatus Woesearchaeota archaeon]|nr:hypothetical protein [Candidatus Woesearchaeota archaeon]MDN5327476.1 hypothetical protein [Candidatus Woesearchaeota archaeon]